MTSKVHLPWAVANGLVLPEAGTPECTLSLSLSEAQAKPRASHDRHEQASWFQLCIQPTLAALSGTTRSQDCVAEALQHRGDRMARVDNWVIHPMLCMPMRWGAPAIAPSNSGGVFRPARPARPCTCRVSRGSSPVPATSARGH